MSNIELGSILKAERAPACDVYHTFIHSVNACMRTSGYTRAGLADRMNSALKVHEIEVDEGKLNKWFAPSQPQSMPIHYLAALCWALKSMEPANILLEPLLHIAVDQRAQLLQRHAELELQKQASIKEQNDILRTLEVASDA